jgi:hypothetical protein
MPGNEKRSGPEAADPDPAPYLYLTFEMKRNDMAKPYDAKRYGHRLKGLGIFARTYISLYDLLKYDGFLKREVINCFKPPESSILIPKQWKTKR